MTNDSDRHDPKTHTAPNISAWDGLTDARIDGPTDIEVCYRDQLA